MLVPNEGPGPEVFSLTAQPLKKGSKPKKFVLAAASETEKDEWLAAIQTSIDLLKVRACACACVCCICVDICP